MTAGRSVTTIEVGGAQPYPVRVGAGVRHSVAEVVADARVVAVVSSPPVASWAAEVSASLEGAGMTTVPLPIPAGEAAKDLEVASSLWDAFAAAPLGRDDAVVAVGGGATTDVVGFAAATWLRGVRVVHVPTTLLAMVDAAVGGKTGLNTAAGKNLVGAFHAPAGVLVDTDVLRTLPSAEWVNGMAEVVKAGFVADPAILDVVAADPPAATRPDGAPARELLERAIAAKAAVVAADFRESGPREALNYGHTLGHAIERVEGYRWPHGHAVSVGMVFAAGLAVASGRADPSLLQQHRGLLDRMGLPVRYRPDRREELLAAMRLDKKGRRGVLRFVVLEGPGRPGILTDPDPQWLDAAFVEVGA